MHTLFVADGDRLLTALQGAGAKEEKGHKTGVWKLPELPDLERRIGGRKPDGVVKQVQSVVPPTFGVDGKAREWTSPPSAGIAELPEAAYVFLEGLAAKNRSAVEQEPSVFGAELRAIRVRLMRKEQWSTSAARSSVHPRGDATTSLTNRLSHSGR